MCKSYVWGKVEESTLNPDSVGPVRDPPPQRSSIFNFLNGGLHNPAHRKLLKTYCKFLRLGRHMVIQQKAVLNDMYATGSVARNCPHPKGKFLLQNLNFLRSSKIKMFLKVFGNGSH